MAAVARAANTAAVTGKLSLTGKSTANTNGAKHVRFHLSGSTTGQRSQNTASTSLAMAYAPGAGHEGRPPFNVYLTGSDDDYPGGSPGEKCDLKKFVGSVLEGVQGMAADVAVGCLVFVLKATPIDRIPGLLDLTVSALRLAGIKQDDTCEEGKFEVDLDEEAEKALMQCLNNSGDAIEWFEEVNDGSDGSDGSDDMGGGNRGGVTAFYRIEGDSLKVRFVFPPEQSGGSSSNAMGIAAGIAVIAISSLLASVRL